MTAYIAVGKIPKRSIILSVVSAGTVPKGNFNEILDFPIQQTLRGFLLQGLTFHFERRIEDRAIGLPLSGRSSRAGVPQPRLPAWR
jgi:hypothetical protein